MSGLVENSVLCCKLLWMSTSLTARYIIKLVNRGKEVMLGLSASDSSPFRVSPHGIPDH